MDSSLCKVPILQRLEAFSSSEGSFIELHKSKRKSLKFNRFERSGNMFIDQEPKCRLVRLSGSLGNLETLVYVSLKTLKNFNLPKLPGISPSKYLQQSASNSSSLSNSPMALGSFPKGLQRSLLGKLQYN